MSLAPAARSIRVWAKEATDPKMLSKLLADGAREALKEAIAAGEAPDAYDTYVDGVKDASEDLVTPDGEILYSFMYMPVIVTFALEFLRLRSPSSGAKAHPGQRKYRDSFMLASVLTGRPITPNSINIRDLDEDAYFIYNSQPYGRRVDSQFKGKKRIKFKVPPGIWLDAVAAIKKRYGNFVNVQRRYTIKIPNQYVIKKGAYAGRQVETPAILITRRA